VDTRCVAKSKVTQWVPGRGAEGGGAGQRRGGGYWEGQSKSGTSSWKEGITASAGSGEAGRGLASSRSGTFASGMVTTKSASSPIMGAIFGRSQAYKHPLIRILNGLFLVASYMLVLFVPVVACTLITLSEHTTPASPQCKVVFPLRCAPADACSWKNLKCILKQGVST
jgi:hypothetical protein